MCRNWATHLELYKPFSLTLYIYIHTYMHTHLSFSKSSSFSLSRTALSLSDSLLLNFLIYLSFFYLCSSTSLFLYVTLSLRHSSSTSLFLYVTLPLRHSFSTSLFLYVTLSLIFCKSERVGRQIVNTVKIK